MGRLCINFSREFFRTISKPHSQEWGFFVYKIAQFGSGHPATFGTLKTREFESHLRYKNIGVWASLVEAAGLGNQ